MGSEQSPIVVVGMQKLHNLIKTNSVLFSKISYAYLDPGITTSRILLQRSAGKMQIM